MRSEFEKLPEIARRIAEANSLNYDEKLNAWTSPEWDSTTCCNQDFVNAAWYAFQEQQKKMDAVKSKLSNIYDACDDNTTVALLLDEIQDLLK